MNGYFRIVASIVAGAALGAVIWASLALAVPGGLTGSENAPIAYTVVSTLGVATIVAFAGFGAWSASRPGNRQRLARAAVAVAVAVVGIIVVALAVG